MSGIFRDEHRAAGRGSAQSSVAQPAIGGGLGALFGRSRAIIRCLLAVARCTGAIICCLLAIARCTGVIIRRLLMIACGPERLPLSSHQVSRLGPIVLRLGAWDPRRGCVRTLISRDVSRCRGSQAGISVVLSELRRMRTMHTGRVASPLVRSGGGFLIAGRLILIRGRLVAV